MSFALGFLCSESKLGCQDQFTQEITGNQAVGGFKKTDTRRPKTARQQPPVLRDVHASPLAITHYQGFVRRPMAVVTHTVVMRLAAQTALAFLPGDGAHARCKPVLMGCNVRLEFHHSQPMSPQNGWIWMNENSSLICSVWRCEDSKYSNTLWPIPKQVHNHCRKQSF